MICSSEHAQAGNAIARSVDASARRGQFQRRSGSLRRRLSARRRPKAGPKPRPSSSRTAASSRWSAVRCAAAAGSPPIPTSPSSSLAEKERDSLRQREQRRRAVDAAIGSFRARVESVLDTVSQSAIAMKAAAKLLLTTSDHTLRRAEGAVHGSNAASANVETAATAAAELSRFDQGNQPPARPDQSGRARRGGRRQRYQ